MNKVKYLREMLRGKDTYRILMNALCEDHTLQGDVLDIGSGVNLASYHRFFKKEPRARIMSLDLMINMIGKNEMKKINLEYDPLPTSDNSVDIALSFNFFEHIYNHTWVMKETNRVLKPGGTLIGAVPFLVGYHADPHDFWRYTHETLQKRFQESGFNNIKITSIGRGPFTAAFFQIEFVLPNILKLIAIPLTVFLDMIIIKIKPNIPEEKFALGLFFVAQKK